MIEKVPRVAVLWGRLCLVAKSLWRPIGMGWLAPYSNLGPTVALIRGQGLLLGSVLSRRVRMGGGALLRDMKPPALDACGGIDCLSTYVTNFYIEYVVFYYGILTLCGKCYGTYVCIPD
jgi:hypothetical protein